MPQLLLWAGSIRDAFSGMVDLVDPSGSMIVDTGTWVRAWYAPLMYQ